MADGGSSVGVAGNPAAVKPLLVGLGVFEA
jgi:hypothetical protein